MSQNAPNGGNAVNLKTGKKPPKSRSTYDLSYRMACTPRYGFVTPFFKYEGVPADRVSLRSGHNLRTLSLKSPLFQNLRMNKDFYAVPMKALLPLNWDKLYNNPVQGEDINPEAINTLIGSYSTTKTYGNFMYELLTGMKEVGYGTEGENVNDLRNITYCIMMLENFAGKGNLFESFRIDPWFGINKVLTVPVKDGLNILWRAWHAYLDKLVELDGNLPYMVDFIDDDNVTVYSKTYDLSNMSERMRMFYDMLDNPAFNLPKITVVNDIYKQCRTAYRAIAEGLKPGETIANTCLSDYFSILANNIKLVPDQFVNIAPILAYQMVIMEYFTNDKVDLCYNSDMFRQIIFTYGILSNFKGASYDPTLTHFTWNGRQYSYDAFSTVGLYNIGSFLDTHGTGFTNGQLMLFMGVMNMLFSLQRGLKYIDYFTGARTRPIAVGDLNVAVNENKVDVIDVTKKIQWQRFLNQVNRIGPDAKNYLKGLFDVEERQHIDVPVKIGHIDETVYGEEVQNTGVAQQTEPNSITTNLKSRGSNFAFEFSIAESTIVLGLVSFSIRRFYNNGVDPFSRKIDRFDMFNPYLQFVGDQPIYLQEIAKDSDHDDIFGYTGRYAEYKNAVDFAVGDFKDTLKSWIFNDTTLEYQTSEDGKHVHVSPEFIRQQPTELDDYYLNMTGNNPGDRYHFICVFDNIVEAKRDMVFNPQILG